MFSAILKEVTAFWDRRALISAFFPSLVFWGASAVALAVAIGGWENSVKQWNASGSLGQGLLLLAFFVWVSFWSFLTQNLHSALFRLYQGDWGLSRLVNLSRRRMQSRWDELDAKDRALEDSEVTTAGEQEQFEALQKSLADLPVTDSPPPPEVKEALARRIGELETTVAALEPERVAQPAPASLTQLGASVREQWSAFAPYRKLTGEPWDTLHRRLNDITSRLVERLERQAGETQEERLRLNHEFLLCYPPRRDDVMPTRLGNVFKAAEGRVWLRYRLDPLLIWSRLQPSLPKEFSDGLQDSKSSLDLMLTLSFFALLFGPLFSVCLAAIHPASLPWILPVLLLAVALPLRFWPAVASGAVALVTTGLAAWVFTAGGRAQVAFTTLSVFLLLASLTYESAIQACLGYGEKIQSAFDLYRWKVLEEMHLQLPPTLEEERATWKQLGELLYRGSPPDADYYRYVADEKKTKPRVEPRVRLPMVQGLFAARRPLEEADLIDAEVPGARLPADIARGRDQLIGKVALTKLEPLTPVPARVLKDPVEFQGRVAMAVQVPPAQVIGAGIVAGDSVDVIAFPPKTGDRPAPEPVKFEQLLVLDVWPASGAQPTPPQCVVVLAVKREVQVYFASRIAGASLVLSRNL